MSEHNTYWEECIPEILDEFGVAATQDQIKNIASAVRDCAGVEAETTGMLSCGADSKDVEIAELNDTLRKERMDVLVPTCALCGKKGGGGMEDVVCNNCRRRMK